MDKPPLSLIKRTKEHTLLYCKDIHKKFLSCLLTIEKKLELHNASSNGNLTEFKILIEEKHYPIMEECSSQGYYWTALHYAAHYGCISIIEYILEKYKYNPMKIEILNMQSNLGLSPLLIGIKNCTDVDNKKKILSLYVKYDCIDYNICSIENEDIFDICQKQGLIDFLHSALCED